MPRWVLWMVVVDSVLIPIGVVLLVIGATVPGVAVLVLDVILMPMGLLFGRGVPGKAPPQPDTTARIFED